MTEPVQSAPSKKVISAGASKESGGKEGNVELHYDAWWKL